MLSSLHPTMQQALAPIVRIAPPPTPLAATVCRECNEDFGPGKAHYGKCIDHKNASWHKSNDAAAFAIQFNQQDKGETA